MEWQIETLHGVYPEPENETLRFAQGDRWRRVQGDRLVFVILSPPFQMPLKDTSILHRVTGLCLSF